MARLRATAVFAVCSLPVIVSSGNPYGNVSFATSCDPAVEGAFNTAMSQLYSFEYDDAHAAFESILAQTDSQCCMAFVGAAWSFTHPIWDFITDDRLESTREMSLKASECVAASSDALTRGSRPTLTLWTCTRAPTLPSTFRRIGCMPTRRP